MTIPPSLPLAAHLAVNDFEAASGPLKERLIGKLKQLQKLEQNDFTDDPALFRKYAAIRADVDSLIDFVKVAELTIQALCEALTQGPRLRQYRRLWIANEDLTQQNQSLQQANEILTDLLITHYESFHDKRTIYN